MVIERISTDRPSGDFLAEVRYAQQIAPSQKLDEAVHRAKLLIGAPPEIVETILRRVSSQMGRVV